MRNRSFAISRLLVVLALSFIAAAKAQPSIMQGQLSGHSLVETQVNLPWHVTITSDSTWNGYMRTALQSQIQGKYRDSVGPLKMALAESRSRQLLSDCQIASLYHLGVAYQACGDLDKAGQSWLELQALAKAQVGAEHPDALRTYEDLAVLYDKQGRLKESEAMYRQSLSNEERILGPNHPEIARCLNELAEFYIRHKRNSEAIQVVARLLAIKKNALGSLDQEVGRIEYALAQMYSANKQYSQAEELYRSAVECGRRHPGRHKLDLAEYIYGLGCCLVQKEHSEQGEALLLESLAMKIKELGPEDALLAGYVQHLGEFYRVWAQSYNPSNPTRILELNKKSVRFFSRAALLKERYWGQQDPRLLEILQKLADAYQRAGDYEQAEQIMKKEIAITVKDSGPWSIALGDKMMGLATIYAKQKKIDQAESQFDRAEAIYQKAHQPGIVGIATEYQQMFKGTDNAKKFRTELLARFYYDSGDYGRALALYNNVLQMKEKAFGVNSFYRLGTLLHMGEAFQGLGKYEQAELFTKRALNEAESRFHDPFTKSICRLYLARVYAGQKKYEQALPSYEVWLEIYKQLHRPDTAGIAMEYANVLRKANHLDQAEKLERQFAADSRTEH